MAEQIENFIALDLELNQPSGTIIQVGVAIGNINQDDSEYRKGLWYIKTDEVISPEITILTGITQEDHDTKGVSLHDCARELSSICRAENVFVNPVTWGGGDADSLRQAFRDNNIEFHHFGRRHLDVKTMHAYLAFANPTAMKNPSGGLKSIMGRYKLPFKGQPHRADVDAVNTLRLFFGLVKRQRILERAARIILEEKSAFSPSP